MHRIAIATATLLTLFCHGPSLASTETLWMCALSEDAVRIVCVADVDPGNAAWPTPKPAFTVNGTAFPLDPRRLYTVDLWSPPADMAFVEKLVRATICYRSPGCSVVVTGSPWAAQPPPATRADHKATLR